MFTVKTTKSPVTNATIRRELFISGRTYLYLHAAFVLSMIVFAFPDLSRIATQLRVDSVLEWIAMVGVFLMPGFAVVCLIMSFRMLAGECKLWRIVLPDAALCVLHVLA